MNWYQLDVKNKQGDIVEYSTDFDFFLKNQIVIVKSGCRYKFQSRIESKIFRDDSAILRQNYEFTDTDTTNICLDIHKQILNGEFGKGKLVNQS